jgi:cell division protein FtsB
VQSASAVNDLQFNMTGRIIFAALVLSFLVLQYKLWFDKGSIPRAHVLERDLADLKAKNDTAKRQNSVLDADVKDLEKAGEAIEERARNELGMIKKGEVLIQVKEPSVLAPAPVPAPVKP